MIPTSTIVDRNEKDSWRSVRKEGKKGGSDSDAETREEQEANQDLVGRDKRGSGGERDAARDRGGRYGISGRQRQRERETE